MLEAEPRVLHMPTTGCTTKLCYYKVYRTQIEETACWFLCLLGEQILGDRYFHTLEAISPMTELLPSLYQEGFSSSHEDCFNCSPHQWFCQLLQRIFQLFFFFFMEILGIEPKVLHWAISPDLFILFWDSSHWAQACGPPVLVSQSGGKTTMLGQGFQ